MRSNIVSRGRPGMQGKVTLEDHFATPATLGALPMQDPEAAANELTRCVRDLGCKGALVNGFSQVGAPDRIAYYDLPIYRPFWAVVESLELPFYLHPRNPLPNAIPAYDGHP